MYAKNPISTYAGQSVKVNSKKSKLEFLKRFAIPHAWSVVYDMETKEEHRFYKKGKKIMQIPIQSLNNQHSKKFKFEFDHDIYRYFIEKEELNQIELVLSDGTQFNNY